MLSGSDPIPLATLDDTVFFAADDRIHGRELWKSDGTAAGTEMIADIAPGGSGSDIRSAAVLGNDLFFVANDGLSGLELWKLDLITEAFGLVKDIRAGDGLGSLPVGLTVFNNELFFSALDDSHGRELWRTDGTEAGTTLAADIVPGATSGSPSNLTIFNGELIFSASGVITTGSGRKQRNLATGKELWKTDGTAAGTTLIKDLAEGSASSFPSSMIEVDGKLFFTASGSSLDGKGRKTIVIEQGKELWVTDGTTEGTTQVKDIVPGKDGSAPTFLTDVGGTLFFAARDGRGRTALWKSDGTESGTQLVLDMFVFKGTSSAGALPVVGSKLFFNSFGPTGDLELFAFDTDLGAVHSIRSVLPAHAIQNGAEVSLVLETFAGTVFFSAFDPDTGLELWKVDSATLEAELLLDILPDNSLGAPTPFRLIGIEGGRFFFVADDGVHGRELWFSNGTSGGTDLVLDIALDVTHA